MQGKQDAIIEAIFQAREFRPDGIVTQTIGTLSLRTRKHPVSSTRIRY